MRKAYQLLFSDHCGDAAKIVRFDSDDGHEAFSLAQRETPGRAGELWLDDQPLCRLTRDEDDVWSIHPALPSQTR
ncbi:hypothetical protein [Allopontixanthobacter sp.]|uniref:hypothetical protein n=1 Tax=Allopontixanthobacter sp. TaxID=2906452 RepID=UPI002ABCFA06|nr:hypothetical protein [Allopontixanthobacter sp.]MDZ4308310.1 hypothetical protein [Allopontixanthobacter sp.]